ARLVLAPGEAQDATLEFDMRSLAYFDDAAQAWIAEPGDYLIQAGTSSEDLPLEATVTLKSEWREPARPAR
ncbi:MAG TPA: fibronectin type III-like domain-contianing protein, partial [Deinococcales bacterium]|nr:fibronectin type III-like domain-contianing protein [Deinococcales bacterium]